MAEFHHMANPDLFRRWMRQELKDRVSISRDLAMRYNQLFIYRIAKSMSNVNRISYDVPNISIQGC